MLPQNCNRKIQKVLFCFLLLCDRLLQGQKKLQSQLMLHLNEYQLTLLTIVVSGILSYAELTSATNA